ncbi:MAG: hypothetical protein A2033_10645 [Bacteroidetes bacterium GWA2_31_9]|nr:MAG: hypothetical protein A2033_10645 [Bacteroidetes bacterium GWA2_31_9]
MDLGWKGESLAAQNIAITDDDSYVADPSAMLDVKSVNKGVLLPRLTTAQRNLVSNPATGLLVFDTDENNYYFYNGTAWVNVSSGTQVWNKTGSNIHLTDSTNNVGIGTNTPFGKLEVKADASIGINDPIFQVVNDLGDTIFAVYKNGVRINVEDSPTKANTSKGGFAVGGFSPSKGGLTNEYLRVTPDSVRIYIEENNGVKANTSKGGFAVGGFSPSKMTVSDYLSVNSDSINVSKSLYIPRMTTTERDNLGFTPSEALIIFNTTDKCMQIYENDVWSNIWCFNCAPAFIIQPVTQTICSETNTNFFVSLTGTNLVYQWQISTDGGSTWSDISNGGTNPAYSGATSLSLSLVNVPVSFNGYKFRCNVSAACPPAVTSDAVVLNVGSTPPSITSQPNNQALSNSYTASFSIGSPGYGVAFQWQQSPDGTTWNDIANGGSSPVFSGATTVILNLSNVPPSYNNYKFRCIASNTCGTSATSNAVTLTISIPVLTTTEAYSITSTTALSGGNITSNGGAAVTARGVCWSISPNPTTADNYTTNGTGTGTFTSNLTGLTLGTTYYVRSYATNGIGTAYGNQISFYTNTVDIGQSYQGGIVAYVLQPSDPGYNEGQTHGLIAAPSDQSTGVEWGCYGTELSGADGIAIGTGAQNTIDIITGCTTTGIAAYIADTLILGGYSDWYLPSRDELNMLYLNKDAIGGFSTNGYWSSSEVNASHAWLQNFNNGNQYFSVEYDYFRVRCVRSF